MGVATCCLIGILASEKKERGDLFTFLRVFILFFFPHSFSVIPRKITGAPLLIQADQENGGLAKCELDVSATLAHTHTAEVQI